MKSYILYLAVYFQKSKHMGGQRSVASDVSNKHKHDDNASTQRQTHEPASDLDTSDAHSEPSVTSYAAPPGLGSQQRQCSGSLDTLVNEDSTSSSSHTNGSCIVVDGCEYVVEPSSLPLPPVPGHQHSLSHVTATGSSRKPPSDCSSSSGIGAELRDTQSDTSSYSGRTPETKSVLVKRKKQRPPHSKARKNVTFSENVVLVSTAPEQVAAPEPDYIAYVQALLKRSPGKRSAEPEDASSNAAASSSPSTPLPHRSATPVAAVDHGGKSGYDSDFDEETDDSCASDDVAANDAGGGDKVRCNLCRKKLIEVTQMFCQDCSYYMAQFPPAVS